ncbi:MAG: ice-binding family protein [Candidatus Dojkabacteria bacterium]
MKLSRGVSVIVFILMFTLGQTVVTKAATSPVFGAAGSYAVLGGSIVTNTGSTTITGDVGVSPTIGVPPHITGFPPGVINGTQHDGDTSAANAQLDDTALFGAIDQGCDTTYGGVQDLTLVSPLVAGTYCSTGSFSLTGNLTLSGTGVWIFKSASTIITSPGSSVTGGNPCNIWWRAVSSVTLDTTTSFEGNVLALTSITMNTGATLNGRLLVQTGAVTLNSNVITNAACSAAFLPSTAGGDRAIQNANFPWNIAIITLATVSTLSYFFNRKKKGSLN